MYLTFKNNDETFLFEKINFKDFFLYYKIEEKEIFFENETLCLFLKTNYSENYINSVLSNQEDVTIEIIEKSFEKDGVWIIINKKDKKIRLGRDLSGLGTIYFHIEENNSVHISTNVHDIAHKKSKCLNSEAVYQLLYFDYLWDGQTIYENIDQLKIGGRLEIEKDFKTLSYNFSQPEIIEDENNLTEEENIRQLRQEIVKAHKKYVNNHNVVFLSGGIDSVAMLIAIDDITDKSSIENHSFKVKGTTQDETVYAKSIADHLNVKLSIIERDLSSEINEEVFRENIFKMNNPYPGMWIFGNQVSSDSYRTYFAGQDTRLHTPALNWLDSIAFSIFIISKKGLKPLFSIIDILLFPLQKLFDTLHKRKQTPNKIFLGLKRTLYLFNIKKYLKLVYFKVDPANLQAYGLPTEGFKDVFEKYDLNLKKIKNKRTLYNKVVSKKWIEQYVNDMRYMIDMVDLQGGKLAMPFYDMNLANFSATIPFNLSIKTMKGKSQFGDENSVINKYVLREALVDKIDKKTYLRSKAVSRTGHLIFNQGLDIILRSIIKQDIGTSDSFVKEYKLESFLKRFLTNEDEWIMTDDKYLLKVYYTCCLICYQNHLKS
ncbi:asparagine synthase-related protein [uncultured Aquimarina sp.]|uniref:asparagine synthase-related protein n=1 Tax=uncultured Aquimarina sp. TaxID=575652 RepID=UPI00261208A3|nr:asparagine synthase-related protein [uncultured Aquimarina sp.]